MRISRVPLIAAILTTVALLGTATAQAQEPILPGGISSHLPEAEQQQFLTDPFGAVVYQAWSGSVDSLHASVGATMFASMYSTAYLSPAAGFTGAGGRAAACADRLIMSSDNGFTRFAAATVCTITNPRLMGELDAQFRQTGHF